jgi:hypothetical protein
MMTFFWQVLFGHIAFSIEVVNRPQDVAEDECLFLVFKIVNVHDVGVSTFDGFDLFGQVAMIPAQLVNEDSRLPCWYDASQDAAEAIHGKCSK